MAVIINVTETPGRLKRDTYSSLTDEAFPELVEINEELLDSDSVLGHQGLESLLHVEFNLHVLGVLRGTWMERVHH